MHILLVYTNTHIDTTATNLNLFPVEVFYSWVISVDECTRHKLNCESWFTDTSWSQHNYLKLQHRTADTDTPAEVNKLITLSSVWAAKLCSVPENKEQQNKLSVSLALPLGTLNCIPQCIILESSDKLSHIYWHVHNKRFWLSISENCSPKLHCGNAVNMLYQAFLGTICLALYLPYHCSRAFHNPPKKCGL